MGLSRRQGTARRWPVVVAIAIVIVLVVGFLFTGVEIIDAQRSFDDYRIQVGLGTCNGWLWVGVTESSDRVEVTARDFRRLIPRLWGEDCDDSHIIELEEPLGDRHLIDRVTGHTVQVREALSPDKVVWPYDLSRFTEADYTAALEATVSCIEATDPTVDAYVVQTLDWKRYAWKDDDGKPGRSPAIDQCEATHLAPLR